MKTEVHPAYFPKAAVTCACGNSFTVGSTREKIDVEICSRCHPFYSGEEKLIDTAGRVEKFRAKVTTSRTKKETHQKISKARAERKTSKEKEKSPKKG